MTGPPPGHLPSGDANLSQLASDAGDSRDWSVWMEQLCRSWRGVPSYDRVLRKTSFQSGVPSEPLINGAENMLAIAPGDVRDYYRNRLSYAPERNGSAARVRQSSRHARRLEARFRRYVLSNSVWFKLRHCRTDSVSWRAYAGPEGGEMPRVVAALLGELGRQRDGLCAFKISFAPRADSLVAYTDSEQAARNAAGVIRQAGRRFHAVPRLVNAVGFRGLDSADATGVGIAMEPRAMVTGFAREKRPMAELIAEWRQALGNELDARQVEDALAAKQKAYLAGQRFGTLMSQLLAMALVSYTEGRRLLGKRESYDLFRKFVALAFVRHGVDPSAPHLANTQGEVR